jgi:hypothetical protein
MAWNPLPQASMTVVLAVDDFGDGDVVAHPCVAAGHGPRVGMVRSATVGCGCVAGIGVATGSRCCMVAVIRTLARTCQVSAPMVVRLPPQFLRMMTAGRMACSARQLVPCPLRWSGG